MIWLRIGCNYRAYARAGMNLSKNTPKGGETWQLKWHLNDGERNDNNDSRHITSVLLWKMVGYTPSSFADMVFTDERLKVGLKKGKSDHHALISAKNWGKWRGWEWRRNPCCDCHSYMAKHPTSPTMSLLSQYQLLSLPTTQSSTKFAGRTFNAKRKPKTPTKKWIL